MYKLICVLVSTDHLPSRLWFREEEDFKVAMNYVAVISSMMGIPVLAFILMSNHVHFVLGCSREVALAFITEFKRRYSKYYQRKYGIKEFLRRNGVDIRELEEEDETLERAIAYVQMNSVAAGICANAAFYPWGTGESFFRADQKEGALLSDLSQRKKFRLLHSRDQPKAPLRLTDNGYVDPASFVAVQFVEKLFRTPARYNFFLQNSSKARLRLQESPTPLFQDQVILGLVQELCHSLFRKRSLDNLSPKQTGELLRQLRFRFNTEPAQLARVLELPYETITRLLDTF